ncbi:MAG: hypothetical protein EPN97_18950 [Alphaproteobacteria bacterium]|nr:MAG: hypothetical protein EPN97_18950 [Alphaproteobacteria bacterium]
MGTGPQEPQDPQESINKIMTMLGFGPAPSKFDPAQEKIMREILATKTMYDTEFDRLQGVFAPHLEYLDHGDKRTILFIDPLKVQSAQAYGIRPTDFLSFALREKNLQANPFQLATLFNNAASVTGTAPSAMPVVDAFRHNAAEVVVPKSHMRQVNLDIPGLKPSEITALVNYHEFFHCLHDKYAKAHPFENTPQKREMFADAGAMLEMMRRGKGPEIIDQMIVWRMKGKDDTHATVPALLALKKYVKDHGGAEGVRKMTTKEVLDLCYKATEDGSSMTWISRMQNLVAAMPDISAAAAKTQTPSFKWQDLPFKKNPVQILEDKAFALGGKITPRTLMQANNALQKEYADGHEKNPNDMAGMFLAAYVETAYMKMVQGTDYTAANAKRGAKLNADDLQEIAFVQKKPLKTAAAPAPK